jgi:hypothetical protein
LFFFICPFHLGIFINREAIANPEASVFDNASHEIKIEEVDVDNSVFQILSISNFHILKN